MRPELLNPLFAEIEVLRGVGPQLAKPLKRLGLERVVDLLFHLPTGWVERRRVERLGDADEGQLIIVEATPVQYRAGSGRSPFRVVCVDAAGDQLNLTFFNNPGWARKQLPLGEIRIVSGRLDRYGELRQIVHPDHIVEPAA